MLTIPTFDRRRALAALVLGAALTTPLAACNTTESGDDTSVEVDVPDCDAEDRRKKEIPDCGRKVNGQYREWSWVAAGKTKPPTGWTSAKESSAGKPAPKTSTAKKPTTGGGTKSGTSRSGTSNRRR